MPGSFSRNKGFYAYHIEMTCATYVDWQEDAVLRVHSLEFKVQSIGIQVVGKFCPGF